MLSKETLCLTYLSQCQRLIQGTGCLTHPKHLRDYLLAAKAKMLGLHHTSFLKNNCVNDFNSDRERLMKW